MEVGLVHAGRLRQSVLRSAFEGRLCDGHRFEDRNVGRFVRGGGGAHPRGEAEAVRAEVRF